MRRASLNYIYQKIDNKDFALYDKVKIVLIFHFTDEHNVKLCDLSKYGINQNVQEHKLKHQWQMHFLRSNAANNYRKPLSILYLAKFSKHSLLYETGKFISYSVDR